MKNLLKEARVKQRLLLKDLAQQLNVDASLISKWEGGTRMPTRKQVYALASILQLDVQKLMIEYLSEVILEYIGDEDVAMEALVVAEEKIKYQINTSKPIVAKGLQKTLDAIDKQKAMLSKMRDLDSYRIAQALELEYTFDSNRIEGNTLTLKETDLVINEGITISGKSMREHLEAINHQEAVNFLKHLVENKIVLTESVVLQLHNLILRGIDSANAGKYRTVQVMIKGSQHLPPAPYLVAKQMEDLFIWYNQSKNKMHPVLLAATMSEKFVTIHPFIDGNGRTSRLIMNLILLQHGYVITNIKGDNKSRLNYYNALESVQTNKIEDRYLEFIAGVQLACIDRYVAILKK